VHLLTGAQQGEVRDQYRGGAEGRAADIEALAADPESARRALAGACAELSDVWAATSDDAWGRPVRPIGGSEVPAHHLLWSRFKELTIHSVDLAAGYQPSDWPPGLAERLLDEAGPRAQWPGLELVSDAQSWSLGPEPRVRVSGEASALAAWVLGRSDGADLGGEPLPALPSWG
jgi:maleylpyruvate isomerase